MLSLYELARDLGSLILMTDRVVILQQLRSKTVIGVGKPDGGVYWLKMFALAACVSVAQSSVELARLWHHRLGHPSGLSYLLFQHFILMIMHLLSSVLVIFVFSQNRLAYLFRIVIIKLHVYLNLFIAMSGVHIAHPRLLDPLIF